MKHRQCAAGTDTAVHSGTETNYTWTENADGSWLVRDLRGTDGVDTSVNIEQLQFTGVFSSSGFSPRNSSFHFGPKTPPGVLSNTGSLQPHPVSASAGLTTAAISAAIPATILKGASEPMLPDG